MGLSLSLSQLAAVIICLTMGGVDDSAEAES